jgi:hypothetical protein
LFNSGQNSTSDNQETIPMGHDIAIASKEKQRAALLAEAARLLELVEKEGRSPNEVEDARIVELAARAQELEQAMNHWRKIRRNIARTSNRSSGEGGRMDNPRFMSIGELQQLEGLLNVLLQNKELIESLSLVERQQLKGSRAVARSLLTAQVSGPTESHSAQTPDEER